VLGEIAQKNPDLPPDDRERVARQVGMGAMAYAMLSVDNNKDTVFDWDEALSFDGHTGPYIQYAHVRCNSILKRMEEPLSAATVPEYTLDPAEVQLVDLMSRFPAEVQRAAEEYKPLIIANLAYALARAFSDFYNTCQVLKADPAVRAFRLRLVAAAQQTIANTLHLLGITPPEVM
jgi:arginyl-tRNA synthetase